MGQYDITIASSKPTPSFATTSFRVEPDAIQQDITPASSRRSDGDTRFLTIPTESFWSQVDWSAGFGRRYPPDPTAFLDGVAHTIDGARARSPYAFTAASASLTGTALLRQLLMHEAVLYGTWTIAGVTGLYTYTGGNWSLVVVLPAVPTSAVSFRGRIWIGYGTGNVVGQYTTAGALTAQAFSGHILCPYGSMLFYSAYDSTTRTWRLNRFDPENTAAVPDLAIFPFSTSTEVTRQMVVLGPDLFILFGDSLWKFTSANGNAGVLAGPLDSWVPVGGATAAAFAGRSAVAHQGGLFYSVGAALRRYLPGGQPRTVWPIPGYDDVYGAYDPKLLSGLVSFDDRLWMIACSDGGSATSRDYYLQCWTGAGMHRVAHNPTVAPSAYSPAPAALVGDSRGVLSAALAIGQALSSGQLASTVVVAGATTRVFDTTSRVNVRTSTQDFGMLDIDKALSEVGLAAVVPGGQDITLGVVVDDAAAVAMTKVGSFSATAPEIVYFVPPTGHVLVGKRFRFEISFVQGGATSQSPELYAILALPNPVNPLRRGFRFTLILDESVEDHNGGLVYASGAAVTTALALARQFRTEAHPLLLTWLDGTTYYVRVNALTIRRVATIAGGQPAWRVSVDAQEVT